MTSLQAMCWCAAGIFAGLLHGTLLWRATRQISARTAATGLLRMGLVATVMVAAAMAGNIVVAAVGWAMAFVAVGTWFVLSQSKAASVSGSSHNRD